MGKLKYNKTLPRLISRLKQLGTLEFYHKDFTCNMFLSVLLSSLKNEKMYVAYIIKHEHFNLYLMYNAFSYGRYKLHLNLTSTSKRLMPDNNITLPM